MSNLRRLRRKKEQRIGVSDSLFNRMTSEYSDVLQNIEFGMVSAYRHNPEIDDRSVAGALKAAITGEVPTNEIDGSLLNHLGEVRQLREDIPDDVWQDGLKVVLDSVHNHSTLRTGDRGYLKFVESFMV